MTASAGAVETLICDAIPRLRRAVALDGRGRPVDLRVDRLDRPTLEDGVFLARVEQILKQRNAAVVSLGDGRRGMLAAADARPVPTLEHPLGALLRCGQTIIVQVKADPTGDKAATVTMDVVLTGRLLACAPLGRGVAVSRRLSADAAARQALRDALARRLPRSVGWIVRAAAAQAADETMDDEAARLLTLWRGVAEDGARGGEARLLRPPPDALERLQTAYDAPLGPPPADLDLDALIAGLLRPVVPLAGGGRLIIEPTAALTAVDVDGGAGDALSVNLAAADELARQLRLRNLGGVVMADFIRLKARGDQEKLLARLRAGIADDPMQTDVYGLTRLGLAEMTRARRGRSLAETVEGLGAPGLGAPGLGGDFGGEGT